MSTKTRNNDRCELEKEKEGKKMEKKNEIILERERKLENERKMKRLERAKE